MNSPKPRIRRSVRGGFDAGRAGIAVTELAILLPVLLVIIFGTIEVCTMIRTQQRLSMVAYEGARVAITPESTPTNVQFRTDLLVAENGLVGVELSINPTDLSSLESGDWVQVTVEAPMADNSLVGGWMFPDIQLSESMSIQRP